jgi:hypothetical protein
MPIVTTPNLPPVAAPGATASDIVLQAGSVISARVLQILGPDQVRIAIGGQSIDVLSQVPLQAGQTLQLQVSQTASGIGLAIVNQQGTAGAASASIVTLAPELAAGLAALATPVTTASGNQLTPLETLAVSLATETAATQQTSLAPLFANLDAASGSSSLPPQVQQAVAQALSLRTSLDQNLSGGDIRQAFQASGLFLEASLASGSPPVAGAVPDLKAALIVLRQALASSLAEVTATGGLSGATEAVQQGTTASAVARGTPSADSTAQEGASLPGIKTVTVQETASPSTSLTQAPQSSLQPSVSPLVIIAGAETPVIEPPVIAPQPASTVTQSTTTAQNAATVAAQEILDLVSSSQILSAISSPGDAVARAAASSAALNLLQEALQAGPLGAGNPSKLVLENGEALALVPAITGARTSVIDDAEFSRANLPPPPVNGALPAAQPVAPATLNPHAPLEATLQRLLADTDGAIARQTLLQVASLSGQTDATTGRIDPSLPRWNFEIPFATPLGTAIAQFEISRDGGGETVEPAKRVWRARFSLDVEPAGPIHALVSLSGERTSVRMWAERPVTASQLRAGVSQLSQALSRADLQVGDIVVRDGAPVQPASAPAGHFLDRAL